MAKTYKHLFFDLDHTLWDFEKNSEETLVHLYYHYGLKELGIHHPDRLVETYRRINHHLWDLYNRGLIEKKVLREKRFTDSLMELGVEEDKVPQGMWELYLQICPTKTNLFPGALEMLEYLSEKYQLSVITNGFEETQGRKLHHSGLASYFKYLLTSEKAGYQKPRPEIFNMLLEMNQAACTETIMIGDNYEADICGAVAAGLDHVYFNPERTVHEYNIQVEIHSLYQLKDLL